MRRVGTSLVGVAGGFSSASALYRFDAQQGTPLTRSSTTLPGSLIFVGGIDMTPDTTKAVATFIDGNTSQGAAYRSTNSGRTYTAINLGGPTPALNGVGVINNSEAFLVGDSSTVIRVNLSTGAVVARLGLAQGIPQTETDPVTRAVISYSFVRAAFASDGQTGYIVGFITRDFPDVPDEQLGVILQTTNGGASWTRQGISGAAGNGLAFPSLFDVQVRSATFAAAAGAEGLTAVRRGTPAPAGACAFQTSPTGTP
jgi:hypothetical protein